MSAVDAAGSLKACAAASLALGDGAHTLTVRQTDRAGNVGAASSGLAVTIDTRTGDTSTAKRRQQKEAPPNLLLTTPESLAVLISRGVQPLLPRRYRVVPAERIAHHLVEAALAATPGVHVLESEQLQ